MAAIGAADAKPAEMIVPFDENSLWGADVYINVTKDVDQAQMTTLSGTFLCKVFEGPFKNMRTRVAEMNAYVADQCELKSSSSITRLAPSAPRSTATTWCYKRRSKLGSQS